MRFLQNLFTIGLSVVIITAVAQAQPITDPQGDVGIGTIAPHASAKLELTSTTKGFLMPRMTEAQRDAIVSPAHALLIFNTTANEFQWYDSFLPGWTGFGAAAGPFWRLDGNSIGAEYSGAGVGNRLGTNNAHDLSIVTRMAHNIDFWTNDAQVAIITSGGDVGIAELAPSARLDVVGDNANPAIEATNNGVEGVLSTVDGGSGTILAAVPSVRGDASTGTGVAGTSDAGLGVYGSSNGTNGILGVSSAAFSGGVVGRNDVAGGFGVIGLSLGAGAAGSFTTTGGAMNTVQINDGSTGDALEINANAGSVGIDLNGGELDGDDQGNALGDGTSAQQLTVRGVQDAVGPFPGPPSTLGADPALWDLVVEGDAVATGIIKSGGSIWVDGVSTPNAIGSDNDLLIGTTSGSTGNIEIDADGGTTTIDDDLIVTGTSDLQDAIFNSTGNNGGDVFINDNATVQSILNVNGNTFLNAELDVDGASFFHNTIEQDGGGQITLSGNVDANNGVDVAGADLTVDAAVRIEALGDDHDFGTPGTNAQVMEVLGVPEFPGAPAFFEFITDDAQINGTLALPAMTPGSVIFAGLGGVLAEDNANFFWDDVNDRIGVGTNAPSAKVHALSTALEPAGRFEYAGPAGTALEVVGTGLGGVGVNINTAYLGGTALNITHGALGGDAVIINETSAGTGLTVNSNASGLGIDLNNGALDGDAAANFLGDGSANQQLTVRGSADAVIGNTLGANPTVWDLVVQGDAVATGIAKLGGSIWIDGVTGGNHQIVADDVLNLGTLGTDDLTLSTNSTTAVTVDGTTQDVDIANDLAVGGNAQVDGDLNVDGATTLDETTVDGTLEQTGGGQVTFSGNVDANNGLDVAGADLNVATNANITGNLEVGGTSDLQGNVSNSTGDLTFDDNIVVTGTSDLQGAVSNSTGNLDLNDDIDVTGHIIPTADATYDLGSNTNRWRDIYVEGASVHIGDAVGTEMELGYSGGAVGTINVNGGSPEIEIDNGPQFIRFDAGGNGTLDAHVRNDGFGISAGGAGSDMRISKDAIRRLGAGETLTFEGLGATALNLNVANGGNLTVSGAGSSFGNGADAEQLEVNGVDGGAVEVDVNGDMDISGTLTVGTFSLTGDLDMGGADIINLGDIVFSSATSNISNTAGDVMIDDNLDVTDAVSVGTTLDVTGNSTFTTFTATGATNFEAASTWEPGGGGPPTTTVNASGLNASPTGPGAAVTINNTNAAGQAINVAAGGGRTILSYGTGLGVIPQDVSVWNATGAVTLPASTENGQILYIVNTSGVALAVAGATGPIAPGFANNTVRAYVYTGGWYELP